MYCDEDYINSIISGLNYSHDDYVKDVINELIEKRNTTENTKTDLANS